MGAMIGPDLVRGIGGFGDTVSDALRNLAGYFDQHRYRITDNRVEVETCRKRVFAEGKTASDAIRNLAWMIAEGGYVEEDFAEPDWNQIAAEPPVVTES